MFLNQKRTKVYMMHNKGIKYSTGSVVSILHSDIFYDKFTISKVMSFLNNPKIDCLIGNTL